MRVDHDCDTQPKKNLISLLVRGARRDLILSCSHLAGGGNERDYGEKNVGRGEGGEEDG